MIQRLAGYRVYLDGVAYGSDKYFNPVNGAKTTEETTYTIKKENLPEGFKASDAHTVTIQAGDTWWKAETTMGAFDKMAGLTGLTRVLAQLLKIISQSQARQIQSLTAIRMHQQYL